MTRQIAIGVISAIVLVACAGPPHGSPTPVDCCVTWDDYTDLDGIGFFLYWAPEAESPRQYIDTRKVDLLRPEPETVIVKDVLPAAKGSLCFKLTAYDVAGKESSFSNEDCGYFGFTGPSGLVIGP